MRHFRFVCLMVGAIFANANLAPAQSPPADFLRSNPKFVQSFRAAIQPHAAAVVRVQCDDKEICLGTIVASDGWILAKAHDLTGKIVCKLSDGRQLEAKLVGVHEIHDLAMMKVAARGLQAVKFSDSQNAKPGSWVASVGLGQDAAAVGVVSVATRQIHEAFLGVMVDSSPQGLIVLNVGPNSPASKAGLQAKDLVVQVNNQKIVASDQFQDLLGGMKPGDALALKVKRGGKEHDLQATLRARDQVNDFRTEFQNRLGSELSSRRAGYSIILQHDSVLKPSDCGGPLVDLNGRVIGINISRAGRVETFAIPAEIVQPLIAELKSGKLAPKKAN